MRHQRNIDVGPNREPRAPRRRAGRPCTRLASLAALLVGTLAPIANAQHANFVLLGPPSVEGSQQPAEQQFVHPVTSPYFHEDSFVTTDVRAWYAYQRFDADSLIDGGKAQVAAVQLRLALTDRLQFVAYKDGYVDFDSGLVDAHGWNDLAAGLKFNFVQDWRNQLHMAVGAGYEFPVGDTDVFQNDQELRLWYNVNKGFGPLHLGGTLNYHLSLGSEGEAPLGSADTISWHLHADYFLNRFVSPVIEVNGYHVVNRGEESVPFMGVDVANFGGGGDVITAGAGIEIRPVEDWAIRGAFELPLTSDSDDLYGWRFTLSTVISF